MSSFVIVGRRLIPREQIALVEPYDRAANPRFETVRDFMGRVVTLNRDSVLIEETPHAFAQANGFRFLAADRVATNPAIRFRVETFLPEEGFVPAKAYASRLCWRDQDSNEQSKLLLSEPETVLAVAVRGERDPALAPEERPRRSRSRGKRAAQEQMAEP